MEVGGPADCVTGGSFPNGRLRADGEGEPFALGVLVGGLADLQQLAQLIEVNIEPVAT
jgi:hypothetical protein